MESLITQFWRFNLEFSLLLTGILLARYIVRSTTKNYNAYLLWVSIPLAFAIAAISKLMPAQMQVQTQTLANMQASLQNYSSQTTATNTYLGEVALVWLIVTAALLIRLALQHKNLRKELRAITSQQSLNIESNYPVVTIDRSNFSPAVYGFLQPKIYFPAALKNELTAEQVSLIVQHEEHHIKQGHLWLNLAWDVLVCLFWFNPFMYWSRQRFRHDQELYCDYLVLNHSNTHRQKSYGHALLSTISATHSVSLLCSWKSLNHLEERIMNIKSSSSPFNKIMLALSTFAIVGSASLYAMAGSHKEGEAGHDDKQGHKHVEKRVIMMEHDESSDRKIKINLDGKQYVEKNGEKYVIEDGNQRPMTEEEQKTFESHVSSAQKHTKVVKHKKHIKGKDGKTGHKMIKVIRTEGGEEMSEEEIAKIIEEAEAMAEGALSEVEIELMEHEVEMASVEKEMENAMRDLEAAYEERAISQKEMKKAQKQIESARAQLEADRKKMEASIEQARKQTEKVRKDLNKDKRAY